MWGRGLGRVTVRFEGPRTAPGPVRTLSADDPLLQPAEPPDWRTPRDRTIVVGLGDDGPGAQRRRVRRAGRPAARACPTAPAPCRPSRDLTCRHRGSRRRRPLPGLHRPRRARVARLRQGLPGRRPGAGAATWARAPDLVALPRTEADVVAAARLGGIGRDRPSSRTAAAARWSAGSSTAARARGCLARPHRGWTGCWRSDRVSRAARIQARRARPGAGGPAAPARPDAAALPAELRVLHARRLARHPRRRPLRHPAHPHRRPGRVDAGGHPDRGQRVVAAAGLRAPGPSPDRMFLGSEGTLGVITEAWMRLQDRPRSKASAVRALRGHDRRRMAAVRAISQAGLYPANCRLLDPGEAALAGAAPTRRPSSCSAWSRRDRPGGRPARRAAGPGPRPRRRPRTAVVRTAGTTPPTPGARRSCGCPTSATGWPA